MVIRVIVAFLTACFPVNPFHQQGISSCSLKSPPPPPALFLDHSLETLELFKIHQETYHIQSCLKITFLSYAGDEIH